MLSGGRDKKGSLKQWVTNGNLVWKTWPIFLNFKFRKMSKVIN